MVEQFLFFFFVFYFVFTFWFFVDRLSDTHELGSVINKGGCLKWVFEPDTSN